MEEAQKVFWKSLRPLFGQIIGVGLFGLPYVFAQAGFAVGVVALLVSGAVCTLTLLMYADMAIVMNGHGRFVGMIREQTGPIGGFFAAVGLFGGLFGAMTAYLLLGGSFAYQLFSPLLSGTVAMYRVLFFVLAALTVFGGMMTVGRLQKYLIIAYLALIAILVVLAAPHVDVAHFTSIVPEKLFLPFGVTLFALTGFAAVPEMRDVLGRRKHVLHRAVVVGMALIVALYLVFTTVVVGVTGKSTTPETLHGLAEVLGSGFVLLAAAIGLCTVFTAFVTHCLVLTNTLVYDYRLRYLVSWGIAVAVPIVLVLLGADDFIGVVNFTGGVFVGISGLVLIGAYERLRRRAQTSKRMLAIPQWLVFTAGCIFIVNIGLALFA